MRSAAVTTQGEPGETYERFTERVAEDQARVDAKVAALDAFIPHCTACGETCNQGEAGTRCKKNGMSMASRWSREVAKDQWYRLGSFGGAWSNEVKALACLLDRVRAGAEDPSETRATAPLGTTTGIEAALADARTSAKFWQGEANAQAARVDELVAAGACWCGGKPAEPHTHTDEVTTPAAPLGPVTPTKGGER